MDAPSPADIIWNATEKGFGFFGDTASQEFYAKLKERKFQTTRCTSCREIWFPPRPFCVKCFGKSVAWVDLPTRGKVYAFTTQHRALRFTPPDVIGLVDLPGVGRILTKFAAPVEQLSIGQDVELDFVEIHGGLVLHQFKPCR